MNDETDTVTQTTDQQSLNQKAMVEAQLMGKSTGIAALLALLFGGIGLLYASIPMGIVATVIEIVMLIVVVFTAGLGFVLYIPWHIICVIAAIVLVGKHNKRLLSRL